eukprot:219548_1
MARTVSSLPVPQHEQQSGTQTRPPTVVGSPQAPTPGEIWMVGSFGLFGMFGFAPGALLAGYVTSWGLMWKLVRSWLTFSEKPTSPNSAATVRRS